jgi:hypothetical protein
MDTDLLKDADLEKIAKEGTLIYEKIRSEYEPNHIGEFLAIEIESGNAYRATSSAEAMVAARAAHPGKVFYVVKIGFDAAETMAHLFPEN